MRRAFQALGPAYFENMAAGSGTGTVSTRTLSAVGSQGEAGVKKREELWSTLYGALSESI